MSHNSFTEIKPTPIRFYFFSVCVTPPSVHDFFDVEKLINSHFLPYFFFPSFLPSSLNVSAAISPCRRSTPEHSNGIEGSQEEPEQFGLIAQPLLNIAKRPPWTQFCEPPLYLEAWAGERRETADVSVCQCVRECVCAHVLLYTEEGTFLHYIIPKSVQVLLCWIPRRNLASAYRARLRVSSHVVCFLFFVQLRVTEKASGCSRYLSCGPSHSYYE